MLYGVKRFLNLSLYEAKEKHYRIYTSLVYGYIFLLPQWESKPRSDYIPTKYLFSITKLLCLLCSLCSRGQHCFVGVDSIGNRVKLAGLLNSGDSSS